jgi:hypothetical protein
MINRIATCGDSFGCGLGLPDATTFEDSFAGIVAKHFNLPQEVYARSGCCNFTIYLQVKKIIERMSYDAEYKPFVLITTTFHERLIFPLDEGWKHKIPDLADVEYTSYVPYNANTNPKRKLPFAVNPDSRLITETISNINHVFTGADSSILKKVEKTKFDAIINYYTEIFDTGVKKEYDEALFVVMSNLLTHYNVPHLIGGHNLPFLIPEKNRIENNWGYYTSRWPDNRGSGHCNEEGNRLVGEEWIKHIEKYKLI